LPRLKRVEKCVVAKRFSQAVFILIKRHDKVERCFAIRDHLNIRDLSEIG